MAMQQILFVDDDPAIRRYYEFSLAQSGFSVVLANDGVEALARLKTVRPDAIVCDLNMPVMDGFALRAELRKNNEYNQIPFLFLTASSSKDDALHGLELDVDEYIAKSEEPRLVIARLQALLRRRRQVTAALTDELAAASSEAGVQLIPGEPAQIPGYCLAQWHQPHHGVPGGDFLDYIPLDDQHWLVVIGDVMGKRWKAWMFAHAYMAYIRSSLRTVVLETPAAQITPGAILSRLNHLLCRDERTAETLCTLCLVLLDTASPRVLAANAAHLPVWCQRRESGTVERLAGEGIFLGLRENAQYEDQHLVLATGDRLLLLTDGFTEASNDRGDFFAVEGVDRVLSAAGKAGLEQVPGSFREALTSHAGRLLFDDDLTLICIEKD